MCNTCQCPDMPQILQVIEPGLSRIGCAQCLYLSLGHEVYTAQHLAGTLRQLERFRGPFGPTFRVPVMGPAPSAPQCPWEIPLTTACPKHRGPVRDCPVPVRHL
jgi:hypothetical protein